MTKQTTTLLGEVVFTTGQIADVCHVAPRTVTKWFDSGRLKGYRIPGGSDRRVPRENLVAFLEEYGLPVPSSLQGRSLLFIGCAFPQDLLEGLTLLYSPNAFTAGLMIHERKPDVVIVDFAIGRSEALTMGTTLRALAATLRRGMALVALANEDEPDMAALEAVFVDVFRKPFDPALLAERLRGMLR